MLKSIAVAAFGFLLGTAAACGSELDTGIPSGVHPPPQGAASVAISSVPELIVGQAVTLAATVQDASGQTIANAPLSWKADNSAVVTVSSAGVVSAVGAGQATITALSGSAAGAVQVTVLSTTGTGSPTPPTPAEWQFCTGAGSDCQFTGLRAVRLGGPTGPYIQRIAYGSIPCASYGFGDQDPAPGQNLHCDYGPLMTTTLSNPMPGMSGLGATIVVPLGGPGAGVPRTTPSTSPPVYTDGSGSFRTTCSLVKYAFDDPIVSPGQPGASHLHAFFGNVSVNASTSPDAIAKTGSSTCRGGTLNRTGYWMPALFDSRTGEVQVPEDGVFYYKTGYNIDPAVVKPFPPGLRMIAGNKTATSPQEYATWSCRDHYTIDWGMVPTACPVGDYVRLQVLFPQCWDGVNLDSPDHQSHMAYPDYRNPPQRSTCPASHPITLPAITEHFDFAVTRSSTPANWRLSSDMYSASLPGGYSAHADWMDGWDPTTLRTFVTQCLNKALDCGVASIGNGNDLY